MFSIPGTSMLGVKKDTNGYWLEVTAPTAGMTLDTTTLTYAAGCLAKNTGDGNVYINRGTATSPVWALANQSISASTPMGYAAGAGSTVTQITSSSTGVTINASCGQITTVALTTAAAAEEVFTVTNSSVSASDVIAVSTTYAGAGTPMVSVKGVGAGSFVIVITNLHAANALDALMVINFAVINTVTS